MNKLKNSQSSQETPQFKTMAQKAYEANLVLNLNSQMRYMENKNVTLKQLSQNYNKELNECYQNRNAKNSVNDKN